MTRPWTLMVWMLALPVWSSERPPDETPSSPPEAVAWEAFTWASSLNLRETSTPGATILRVLSINTALTVLDTGSPMTRVRLGDGTEGWVGYAFIGYVPLTLQETDRQVQAAAGVPGDVLSWRQRAAALAPENREVLQALARAYVENGKLEEAKDLAMAHELLLEVTLIATFDGCQQSDTQGVLYNFTDHQGPTGGYGSTNWHSFQESDALRGFCDYDVASPSKLGKRFRLTTVVVDTMWCGGPDCFESYAGVRMRVKTINEISFTDVPSQSDGPPLALPSGTYCYQNLRGKGYVPNEAWVIVSGGKARWSYARVASELMVSGEGVITSSSLIGLSSTFEIEVGEVSFETRFPVTSKKIDLGPVPLYRVPCDKLSEHGRPP